MSVLDYWPGANSLEEKAKINEFHWCEKGWQVVSVERLEFKIEVKIKRMRYRLNITFAKPHPMKTDRTPAKQTCGIAPESC